MSVSPPPFGVYTPTVTFFNEDESIDYANTGAHIKRLLDGGVTGLVVHGSNGEAVHLLREEKKDVIQFAKQKIQAKSSQAVIIAGCSASSARETLLLIQDARDAGADFALVLPPSYWAAAMTKPVIKSYFARVSKESVLPILIYNFPGVTAGIDLDSDLITEIAHECPNIIGTKLTCGNLGKLQRITSSFPPSHFAAYAGKADFLVPGLVMGSNGVISALANVVPKLHVEVVRLCRAGELQKAQDIQKKLSLADGVLGKLGVSGVKAVVSKHFDYGTAVVRSPLLAIDEQAVESIDAANHLQQVIDLEENLSRGRVRL